GKRIDGEEYAIGVDAGEACSLAIVSRGVDVPPPGGLVEPVPGERIEEEHQYDAVGEVRPADVERATPEQLELGQPGEGQVVRDDVGQRKGDVQRAERDDERRQPNT